MSVANGTIIPGISIAYSEKKDGDMRGDAIYTWLKGIVPLHFSQNSFCVPKLVHGVDVIDASQCSGSATVEADAIICNNPEKVIAMRLADCTPIILFDPVKKVTAIIHGGWRSVLQSIVPLTLLKLQSAYHVDPSQLKVWIGPSIRVCCNHMKETGVHTKFAQWLPYIVEKEDGLYLDLQKQIIDSLMRLGAQRNNIVDSQLCTVHQKDDFFSYRRSVDTNNEQENGRMAFAVWMNDKGEQGNE